MKVCNLGCGFKKIEGAVNVDRYDVCEPDVTWNLEDTPLPFDSEEFDKVIAHHLIEHIWNWWDLFEEIVRITKPGGTIEIATPHESSRTAMSWRDHYHIFTEESFHGIYGPTHGTSAWGATEANLVPCKLVAVNLVPYKKYMWMTWACPWLLRFCANHMRNFIHEQLFVFGRVTDTGGVDGASRWRR